MTLRERAEQAADLICAHEDHMFMKGESGGCHACKEIADAIEKVAKEFAVVALQRIDFSCGYGDVGRGSTMPQSIIAAAIAEAEKEE